MRALCIIAAAIAGLLAPWLFGGFVAWDLNVANWPADGRFLCGFFAIVVAALAAVAASEGRP